MKKIVVASKNPVKIDAVKQGFVKIFPDEKFEAVGVSVPSGVPDQPMGGKETLLGANNRAQNAMKETPGADFWVGIEGGVDFDNGDMCAFAWIVVLSDGQRGKAKTHTFYMPPKIAELVKEGYEMGDADDIVFQKKNSKQQNGGVGLLTGDAVTRTELYVGAVVLALIPFNNPDLYGAKPGR